MISPELLNFIFGIITVLSFIFSIYTYFKNESLKKIESMKNGIIQERMRTIEKELISLYNNVDSLVQIPKDQQTSVEELQNLARVIRSNIILILNNVKENELFFQDWSYKNANKSIALKEPIRKEVDV